MSPAPTRALARRHRRIHARYGPWAVVTGASDGIGRELAVRLAEAGVGVALIARRRDRLDALAAELTARHGVDTRVIAADLARPDGIAAVVAGTRELEVGLLVAAAGFGTSGRFLDARIEDELEMIDVNCRAVAALAHHFGRRFAAARRGGIVLMSSLLAFQGVPRAANYAATKAYVQSLAEGLGFELESSGVDVLACAPGPIASGFGARANMVMGMSQTPEDIARKTLLALGRRRLVRPGFLSWFLQASLATLPRWARVLVMARIMRGMVRPRALPDQATLTAS